MAFGILLLIVVLISWNTIPDWKNMKGGLWILIGGAAVGVLAFLKDSISFIKTWLETQAIEESQPTELNLEDEQDSRTTNIKWEARDPQLVKKYFDLYSKYDDKFTQYNKEHKQIEYSISFGLVKKNGNSLFLTQAGVLLFCKKDSFPHSILHTDVILRFEEQADGIEKKRDFSGAILETYFHIFEILKPLTTAWKATNIRNQDGQEEEFFFYPDIAITETLVNFFIHRDYLQDDIGFITIYEDRIEFLNPGTSVFSADELLKANKPLRPPYRRNPRLLQALRKTGLNQSEGKGILRIKDALTKNKSVDPRGEIGLFIENNEIDNRFRLVVYKKIPSSTKPRKKDTKPKMLIIEDDIDTLNMMKIYFIGQGYDVFSAYKGEMGLSACRTFQPDVVILDIMLPDIDGYEVARNMRTNRHTQNIPIIFLTQRDERSNRLQGLEIGADDYITKPFDIEELTLRVKGTIRLASRRELKNPITDLPAGDSMDRYLSDMLNKSSWALIHISILHLDHFRGTYGFLNSDEALKEISTIIRDTISESGEFDYFLGHISPTDFVIGLPIINLNPLYMQISSNLGKSLVNLYPEKDRKQILHLSNERLAVRIFRTSSEQNDFPNVSKLKMKLLNMH